MTGLPRYDDLPADPAKPPRSTWGLWGDDDTLGCLNLLTAERAAAAARLVRSGRTFALGLPLDLPDPPLFAGRSRFRHEVRGRPNGVSTDDVLHDWNTQSSSQWDGFRHIRHPVHGLYNGLPHEAHGVDHWARRGLAGRGVLVDVARWRTAVGRPLRPGERDPIGVTDLEAALAAQGTDLPEGSVLLVRTGWLAWYRGLDASSRAGLPAALAACGLAQGEDTARWLWDHRVAAVAADNPALEAWPAPGLAPDDPESVRDPAAVARAFLHFALLPLLGMPIGELWDLDPLADDCAADGRYEGLFTSAPLPVPNGVASPPNALLLR